MSFQILFNKTGSYENMATAREAAEDQSPPPYTEATNPFTSTPASTSSGASSLENSEKPPLRVAPTPPSVAPASAMVTIVSTPSGSPQLTPASSVAEELSALQRAHLHLYKRLQEVKTQTYAALIVVLLLAGLVMVFLVTYGGAHHGNKESSSLPALLSGADLPGSLHNPLPASSSSFRSGKALVASTASLVHDNSLPEDIGATHGSGRHANDNQRIDWNDNLENGTEANLIKAEPSSTTTTTSTTTPPPPSTTTIIAQPSTSFSVVHSKNASASIPTASTYKVSILIHKATVPNMDSILGKASDTYCDVYIDEVNVGSTTVIDNDNTPNWQYLFSKPFIVKRDSVIRIDLIDLDNLKKDHIGGTRVVVEDLIKSERLNRPIRLFHGKGDIWITFKLE